jgi:hypothetical protein
MRCGEAQRNSGYQRRDRLRWIFCIGLRALRGMERKPFHDLNRALLAFELFSSRVIRSYTISNEDQP